MAATNENTSNGSPKKLILNAFVESCSGHQSPGLWRHPDDRSWNFNDIHHWVDLAKLLEKGKFHGMFIADVLASLPASCYVTFSLTNSTRGHMTYTRVPKMQTQPSYQEHNGLSTSR